MRYIIKDKKYKDLAGDSYESDFEAVIDSVMLEKRKNLLGKVYSDVIRSEPLETLVKNGFEEKSLKAVTK